MGLAAIPPLNGTSILMLGKQSFSCWSPTRAPLRTARRCNGCVVQSAGWRSLSSTGIRSDHACRFRAVRGNVPLPNLPLKPAAWLQRRAEYRPNRHGVCGVRNASSAWAYKRARHVGTPECVPEFQLPFRRAITHSPISLVEIELGPRANEAPTPLERPDECRCVIEVRPLVIVRPLRAEKVFWGPSGRARLNLVG
ncbi:hypothetical protein FBY31_0239 [Arthrobacter sp. SLBN-100]|nr:hypothetical protein FBY31_0239 [Arthrobacter sp. SLBN-100]